MANLTIRNLDDAVVDRLKVRAKAHNRSLEAEVRTILEATARTADRKAFIREARRIAAMTPKVPQTDSTLLIREDRDSDHGRDE
ncbi:MAG: plasmid stabilization protein [Rhodospirillales bacterium]|nr:plasmid stabilization protein [Rhodospirillales bacterium]MDH3790589.1 plasmid stabilization protein [Rhodospirillales bacterium]MDH3910332.1 plasmid stabilization protein [Rhodospirillales bacterium]MDH3916810.1 plasmid stabilization protein [Rhodospirillales bacterium]MDH3967272.1 plasmid stabilization protein [Rhodospirillales bacterium]